MFVDCANFPLYISCNFEFFKLILSGLVVWNKCISCGCKMNESDFISVLKQCGWRCRADEVGVCVCFFDINKKVVAVIPTIGKRVDHFRVSLMPSISSVDFSSCVGLCCTNQPQVEPPQSPDGLIPCGPFAAYPVL